MQQKSSRGVQQDDVWAAADALLAEGLRPTIERVRQKIGRGSPNTVSPMLEAWFAKLGARLGVAGPAEREGGVPEPVRRAMDALWASALAEASKQADSAYAHDRENLAAQLNGLQAARDEIAREQEAMAAREAALNEGLAIARGQLDEQARRIARLEGEIEQRNRELADVRKELARLIAERDTEREGFDARLRAHAQERQKAEERAASSERRLLEEVDRARQETKQARSALQDAQRQQQQTRQAQQEALKQLGSKHHETELELASLRERLISSERRETDMRQLLEEQKSMAASALAQLTDRTSDLPAGRRKGRAVRPSSRTPTRR